MPVGPQALRHSGRQIENKEKMCIIYFSRPLKAPGNYFLASPLIDGPGLLAHHKISFVTNKLIFGKGKLLFYAQII